MEKIIRAAVKLGDGDDMVACAGDVEDGVGDGGLSGGKAQGSAAALQGSHSFLEDRGGGVGDASVDVADFLDGEEIGSMGGVVKTEAARLINWNGTGTRGRIGFLASMEGFAPETL